MGTFLSAKEQIGICGSVVDEEIAARAFAQRAAWLAELHPYIAARSARSSRTGSPARS